MRQGLRYVQTYLRRHFGRTDVTLGNYQLHVRGRVEQPTWGMPDVLAAMYLAPYVTKAGQRGQVHNARGESCIMLARFGQTDLPQLETVHCFGALSRPDSPHHTDQMPLFLQMKTEPMTLDKATVMGEAECTCHPGQ